MEFDPRNNIVQHCLQGMALEDKGEPEAAGAVFMQAWEAATNDFEKFLAAYYLARNQMAASDKLKWAETSLQSALKAHNIAAQSALPSLYRMIAQCYKDLNDADNAQKNEELAHSFGEMPSDPGPFYHGTRADLQVGDMLTAGRNSNYESDLTMNHIYFTALANGAGLAAALSKGDGRERVYVVEPTGSFEHDPNVTDKKFPGNLTRSYRSEAPLKVIGEVTDWAKQAAEDIQKWKERLANNQGKIIN